MLSITGSAVGQGDVIPAWVRAELTIPARASERVIQAACAVFHGFRRSAQWEGARRRTNEYRSRSQKREGSGRRGHWVVGVAERVSLSMVASDSRVVTT